jgi:5-methylthioadenosine/S-adenosylhomocysteine deaminase
MSDPAPEPVPCDLLIKNACLITVDDERRIIMNGAIAIDGRRIAAVDTSDNLTKQYRPTRVVDAGGAVVHPGYVEPHIHISQYHSRPATSVFQVPDAPFRYASWKSNLGAEDEFPSTAYGCLELLHAGFTSFVEPGTAFSPDAVAAAAEMMGMRGWVTDPYLWDYGETLKRYPALISDDLMKRVPCDTERCLALLGGQLFRNEDPNALVKGHVAIYGEATATDELRQAAKACARDNSVTFTEHLCFAPAIDKAERERLGGSQIEHAARLGLLDTSTTAVHMNMLRESDLDIIVDSRMSIVWCAANYLAIAASSGVRTFLPALNRRGVNVTLGIDTPATTNPGDSMTIANIAAREAGDLVYATELIEMQTISAARSIGAQSEIGSLATGKRADIVLRKPRDPGVAGFDPVYELALFQRARDVDTVIVDGQIVLSGGHSTLADEHLIAEEAVASSARIIRQIGMHPIHGWPVVTG